MLTHVTANVVTVRDSLLGQEADVDQSQSINTCKYFHLMLKALLAFGGFKKVNRYWLG